MSRKHNVRVQVQRQMNVEFALCCVENCGAHFHLNLSGFVSLDLIVSQLQPKGWLVSVLSPPGVDPPFLGPLCPDCAKKIYPAAMRAAAQWNTPKTTATTEPKR